MFMEKLRIQKGYYNLAYAAQIIVVLEIKNLQKWIEDF